MRRCKASVGRSHIKGSLQDTISNLQFIADDDDNRTLLAVIYRMVNGISAPGLADKKLDRLQALFTSCVADLEKYKQKQKQKAPTKEPGQ